MHGFGRRRVLNELDQLVPKDDLSRRGRNIVSDFKGVGSDRLAACDGAFPVFDEILRAANEVRATFAQGLTQDLGIGERQIGRREEIEIWRTAKVTTRSCRGGTPRMPVVVLCHHCCCSRKAW
jgi:hypothetical protein